MTINESMIKVNDLPVKIIRKDIKNLHLSVYPPDGVVRVAVPELFDDEAVKMAVISKIGWIKRQMKYFREQPRQSARQYISGESHHCFGQRYLLDVKHTDGRPFVEIRNKKKLVLNVDENSTLEKREKLLSDWYRKELKNILPYIIEKWEKRVGVKMESYKIQRMKTKWGSCKMENKTILLNLELAKKPIHCIEYVVLHELLHLLERNHNDRFFDLLNKYMPQWKTYRNELNNLPLVDEKWKY